MFKLFRTIGTIVLRGMSQLGGSLSSTLGRMSKAMDLKAAKLARYGIQQMTSGFHYNVDELQNANKWFEFMKGDKLDRGMFINTKLSRPRSYLYNVLVYYKDPVTGMQWEDFRSLWFNEPQDPDDIDNYVKETQPFGNTDIDQPAMGATVVKAYHNRNYRWND